MADRLYTVSEFYRQKFGCKVYKLSVDAGCTCPNRDGTKGYGGCTFCSGNGSGDFAADRNLPVAAQIEQAKNLVRKKCRNGKFMAYFQNFSSTYGNPENLYAKYREAAESHDIVGVTVATRPDCLSPDIVRSLAMLSGKTSVSVELGLQTSDENTAVRINRCFTDSEYLCAVNRLRAAAPEIHIVTHVIFGLPGEKRQNMMETVNFCTEAGTDGIKFTVLHVLEGTALAGEYRNGEFRCLGMEEYFGLLADAIRILPQETVVHRLTGDGPKRILIAPLWTADKRRVLNSMKKFLEKNGISCPK